MPRRVAVITDAHANLPALEVALAAIREDGADEIVHTGDAIGIGPFPAEVLDRLLHTLGLRCVMGNHDALFAFGLPAAPTASISAGELAHQRWVHAQLDPSLRTTVAAWPWRIDDLIGATRVAFLHHALDPTGHDFADPPADDSPAAFDRCFAGTDAEIVCSGHFHHPRLMPQVVSGRARYVNPGSLGCSPDPVARYALIDAERNGPARIALRLAAYDPAPLHAAMRDRDVTERDFLLATFLCRASGF